VFLGDDKEITVPEFYGPRGEPIHFARKKDKPPLVGELVTPWNGDDWLTKPRLPSQLNIGFDTSRLSLADYRLMRQHHQVSSSLNLLSMMMYQRDWRIVGEQAKVVKHVDANMRELWPRVVRAHSQAFWAGYSPCALQFENDVVAGKLWVTKIKDLRPEECRVRWKQIDGVSEKKPGMAGVKLQTDVFDGILQAGAPDIPVSNSYWVTLMRENGDFYGTKLLDAVFRPWYFSMIMHMYANRYMERFAEPTPIGRAPFDEKITIGGREYSGNTLMASLMQMQRNGSSIILPNSRSQDGFQGDSTYDYIIEYLESAVRGAEFDRIIQMYDEEISLALFTPLLLTRNTDTGSSNLGVVHTNTWLTILNAIAGDWEEYINRYLIRPMAIHNFGPRAKIPKIVFRPLGRTDAETIRATLQSLMSAGKVTVDLEELSAAAGLSLTAAREIVPEEDGGNPDDDDDEGDGKIKRTPSGDERVGRPGKNKTPTGTDKVGRVAKKIAARIAEQATRAFADNSFGDGYEPDLGHHRQFLEVLAAAGVSEYDAAGAYDHLHSVVECMAGESGVFSTAADFADAVENSVKVVAERALHEVQN